MSALLPWHAEVWHRVLQARRTQRLTHALLLAGPAGVGKRVFARQLADELLCEDLTSDRACGQCRGCQLGRAGQHPNLFWLRRELNDRGDRERRDITLDQIRNMLEQISLSGHYGGTKVVVFDPVDALSMGGVNALLKTVEEPPPQTILLLVSERPMALLATLRSRCQRLDFGMPERDVAQRWLSQQAPGADAAALLDASGGAPLTALDDLNSGAAETRAAWQAELVQVALGRRDPLAAAAQVPRDAVGPWLDSLLDLLRRCLRSQACGERDSLSELARRLNANQMEPVIAEALDARRRLNTNPNAQLLVESLMIGWWHRSRTATPPNL